MVDGNGAPDPKEELIQLITSEMSQIREKLKEISAQIETTAQVVEREQARNTDLAAELRTIQDNIETVPRQDIRMKYDEALDARFRLATMRGQLEKFQATQQHLQERQSLLSQLLHKLQGVDVLPSGEEEAAPTTKGTVNIVRIVQAQENERQRLARQMHDGPAQSLTNFILQAEICQRLFDRDPARAAQELENLKSAASITFQKVRDFIFDLRPMMLDDLGVVPTVRRYVESFSEKSDIQVNLEIRGEERRLETVREVILFRAIQRLLGFARDEGSARQIDVNLDVSGDPIKVRVEDDGQGFDVEAAFTSEDGAQLDARAQGLLTLKEEFELIGGTLTVTSDETGTVVQLTLPTGEA